MSKKYNHIDFFKHLMYPEEVKEGIVPFDVWCGRAINEKDKYIEERAFIILHFFRVFKRLYKYVTKTIEDEILDTVDCDINSSFDKLVINITYTTLYADCLVNLKDYFKKSLKDEFKVNCEFNDKKHNTITISFYRKRAELK